MLRICIEIGTPRPFVNIQGEDMTFKVWLIIVSMTVLGYICGCITGYLQSNDKGESKDERVSD